MSTLKIQRIPTREEVALDDTWDLGRLYPDDEAWERGMTLWESRIPEFDQFCDHLCDGAEVLAACEGETLDVELIAPRTVKPLDEEIILESVKKTGRLLAVDYDFPFAGFASEVCAMVAEKGFRYLKDPVSRITFPESSMPASGILERAFHPSAAKIAVRIKEILSASVPSGL